MNFRQYYGVGVEHMNSLLWHNTGARGRSDFTEFTNMTHITS